MAKLFLRICAISLVIFPAFLPLNLHGQGNLMITPKRIVFEGNKKSMDVNLVNIGEDTASYAISLIQNRMTEDGNFEEITVPDEGQLFASPYLRYFPRSVTLAPGEMQSVKIQLYRAGGLAAGEYRSHIYFRAIPKEKPLGEEDADTVAEGISIRLIPIFGITIPVIIRIGEPTVDVTLSDLHLELENTSEPLLRMVFNRGGKYSVYGDVTVDHVATDGKITRVGVVNGLAVYTPNPRRSFALRLVNTEAVDLKSGKLRVTFSAPSDVRPQKYAEAELTLK